MSFRDTLQRILELLIGITPGKPSVDVTNIDPKYKDSKEVLALKWEKYLRG